MVMPTAPASSPPFLLIMLMMPPGEFEATVEAEPPRMDSTRPTLQSDRMKLSVLAKFMSPNSRTGKPSSCSCMYFEPPVAKGMPRTVMLAFPLPPELSERMPGSARNNSATDRGDSFSISYELSELTETLASSFETPSRATPVTITSSNSWATLTDEYKASVAATARLKGDFFCAIAYFCCFTTNSFQVSYCRSRAIKSCVNIYRCSIATDCNSFCNRLQSFFFVLGYKE